MEYTANDLKRLSKELALPFPQVLSLYFEEEILDRISHSDLKNKLWLKLKSKKIRNDLIFYMKHITEEDLEDQMKEIFKSNSKQSYKINWGLWYKDKEIEIPLEIQLGKIQAPIKIIVRPILEEELFPGDAVYTSRLNPERKISYKEYPIDLYLAECFYEIMDKLELIGDMFYYDKAYRILQQSAVEGRRVRTAFKRLLAHNPILSATKRWDSIRSYKNYSHMKKRWKSYFKDAKNEMPDWESTIDLLDAFFSPLWSSIEKDEIFVDDWMPNLGRYLE